MRLLSRPDRVESRATFRAYIDALCRSFDQALDAPRVPSQPAVDDHGLEWENTTLEFFLLAMDEWLLSTGWTTHDRAESLAWSVLALPDGEFTGDEAALRAYLEAVRIRAADDGLPDDWYWRPVAESLAAGRANRYGR